MPMYPRGHSSIIDHEASSKDCIQHMQIKSHYIGIMRRGTAAKKSYPGNKARVRDMNPKYGSRIVIPVEIKSCLISWGCCNPVSMRLNRGASRQSRQLHDVLVEKVAKDK